MTSTYESFRFRENWLRRVICPTYKLGEHQIQRHHVTVHLCVMIRGVCVGTPAGPFSLSTKYPFSNRLSSFSRNGIMLCSSLSGTYLCLEFGGFGAAPRLLQKYYNCISHASAGRSRISGSWHRVILTRTLRISNLSHTVNGN